MKVLVFFSFFICFLQNSFAHQSCFHQYGLAGGWGNERNAAGIFPNDEVRLSDDGQHFVTHNFYNHTLSNISALIPFCPMHTCGRKTFPHGFTIFKQKPLMFCENHRCLNPEMIKCRKSVEYGACVGENEWISGFVERKNETNEWLEVECCHSIADSNEPVFIKNIAESGTYYHEIVVENGTVIAVDYVKDIKKIKNIYGQTIYSASIYRMKCSTFNATNIPSIFDSPESLIDEDGIGKFEGYPEMCNKESDVHVIGINAWNNEITTFRSCLTKNCLKKVECKKNVKIEDCVEVNQWVSDFTKIENNETLAKVECCQYFDEVNATFVEYANFTKLNVEINDMIYENGVYEETYINNITVDENSENGTIYFASVYKIPCISPEEKKAKEESDQKSYFASFGTYFSDLTKRIQQSIAKKYAFGEKIDPDDFVKSLNFFNESSPSSPETSENPSNDPFFNDTISVLSL